MIVKQGQIKFLENETLFVAPKIKISSRLALDGARSSYAPDVNIIYLAEDFVVAADRNDLRKALLQEIANAVESLSQ